MATGLLGDAEDSPTKETGTFKGRRTHRKQKKESREWCSKRGLQGAIGRKYRRETREKEGYRGGGEEFRTCAETKGRGAPTYLLGQIQIYIQRESVQGREFPKVEGATPAGKGAAPHLRVAGYDGKF